MLLYNSAICDLLRESIQIMKILIRVKVVILVSEKWNEHLCSFPWVKLDNQLPFETWLSLLTEKNCNICELIIWILLVFCQFFQILSQNFELCSETNILSQQLSYLCRLLISGLRNAPILSIWKNWQVIFLSSLSTAGTKCKVKQYNSHDTPNFDVSNQN